MRDSKITPKAFFDSALSQASSDPGKSLAMLCTDMKLGHGVTVSKQGLDERYTEKAALFLKSVLNHLPLGNNMPLDEGWFGYFNRIMVKDSTRFDLPSAYAAQMPGFGGNASESGACIQYEYDLKTGSIQDLNLTPANRCDSKDAYETMGGIMPGDLVIRDLGYYSTDVLKCFMGKGAFVISRLNAKSSVFEKEGGSYRLLDFMALYEWMVKCQVSRVEKQVFIGANDKLPVRLVVEVVPGEVFVRRMQKNNAYNKRKGHNTTDGFAARARFNLFITNIPADIMPAKAIIGLYRIRWQVELAFKIWKSTFGVHKVCKMKYYRWLCTLYAKLIIIAICWRAIMAQRALLYKEHGKLLSIIKSFRSMKENLHKLKDASLAGQCGFAQLSRWVAGLLSDNHWLEKKKNKVNFEQIIYLEYCKSNIYVYI